MNHPIQCTWPHFISISPRTLPVLPRAQTLHRHISPPKQNNSESWTGVLLFKQSSSNLPCLGLLGPTIDYYRWIIADLLDIMQAVFCVESNWEIPHCCLTIFDLKQPQLGLAVHSPLCRVWFRTVNLPRKECQQKWPSVKRQGWWRRKKKKAGGGGIWGRW